MEIDQLSQRYLGARATNYDGDRVSHAKWAAEQSELARFVAEIPRGSLVLDVPVGTGRLPELLRSKDVQFLGIDVSEDMIERTREKPQLADEKKFAYELGSIFQLPVEDNFADVSLCIRFLNWVDLSQVELALDELKRVTKREIVIGVRTFLPIGRVDSVRDCCRFLRRAAGYARRRAKKSGLVYHSEAKLRQVLSDKGLEIAEVRMVEERGDGTNYAFYKLVVRR